MTGKKTLLILFVGFISINANAQDIGGYVSVAPTMNSGKSSVGTFMQSYNAYHTNHLEKPFDASVGQMFGYTVMGGMYLNGSFEVGGGYGRTYAKNKAVFKNGDKQIVKMDQQDFLIDMSFGTDFETPLKLSANFGMVFRESDVRVYYRHADGTFDYHVQNGSGQFNQLNGLYHAWKLGFYTGGSLGVTINEGEYRLYLRGDYVFRGKGGFASGTYQDNDPIKQLTLSGSSGVRYELPEDVDMYYNGSNADNVFNSVKNDNWGWRFMLTFQININEAF